MSPDCPEDAFEDALIAAAKTHGWLVHVERRARTSDGRATPIKGDKGWPDVVLAHPSKGLIVAELKSKSGTLRPDQRVWIETLAGFDDGGVRRIDRGLVLVEVWRPADWDWIMLALERGVAVYRARVRCR